MSAQSHEECERGKRGNLAKDVSRTRNYAVQSTIFNFLLTATHLVLTAASAIRPRFPRPTVGLAMLFVLSACGDPPEANYEPPQVLTDSIPFVYPLELWDHNVSGQTILLVRVDATGKVDSVAIDAPSGYPEFDSAAVQGAHNLRFIAGRQGDRRIPMWTKVPVRFSRDTTTKMGIGGS
jgi:TonB family protein